MDKKGIKNFSLEALGKIQTIAEKEDLTYSGCFLARRNSEKLKRMEIFKYPCRINAFIAILCIKGSAKVIHNLQRYTIVKNCLFVSIPNSIIQIESWDDCEIYITAIDEDYAKRVSVDYKKMISVYVGMKKCPYIGLNRNEAKSLSRTFHNMSNDMMLFRDRAYSDEIMNASLNLSAYKFFSIISKYQELLPGKHKQTTSRQDDHYNKFIQLLDKNFKNERSIGFYASQICVTPKYLSSLIKKMSGRTAAEWINGMVIMEAKHLLKYSNMNIQEIAEYLNFPNQSFFTQYFRRETGTTPGSYRKEP
ncbi:MAG TPA: AraC family transcriptional regulator [Bacteroidales bacterium]|jgi:AraC-like DNA-binding protein|nr:AraC family transcriptional regulator [Bacteroidales bacterium]